MKSLLSRRVFCGERGGRGGRGGKTDAEGRKGHPLCIIQPSPVEEKHLVQNTCIYYAHKGAPFIFVAGKRVYT